jgi:preprotein translocase subunit SecG
MGGLMTGRGTANLLSRATAVLAFAFMCSSLILTILAKQQLEPGASFIDQGSAVQEQPLEQQPAADGEGGSGASGSEEPVVPVE